MAGWSHRTCAVQGAKEICGECEWKSQRVRKRFVASVNESRSEPTRVLCDRKKDSKYRWQIYFKQTNTMMIR